MFLSRIAPKQIQMILVILAGLFGVLAIILFIPKGDFLSADIVINEVCCHNETVIYNEGGNVAKL